MWNYFVVIKFIKEIQGDNSFLQYTARSLEISTLMIFVFQENFRGEYSI